MPKDLTKINQILVENGKEPIKEESTLALSATKEGEDDSKEKQPEMSAEPKQASVELDDATVLAYLQKNKGLTVASFEELTPKVITQEDLDKEAERKEAEKISWALQNGKTTTKQYQQYVKAVDDKTAVVYHDYRSEAIAEDDEIRELFKENPAEAEQRIREEFEEKYGLNADPNSRKYKRGQTEIETLADEIIRTNYKEILGIDADYDAYSKKNAEKDAYNKKIISLAPQYKKDVEDVFAELKTIPFNFGGGEVYNVPVQPEMMKDLKEKLLDSKYSEKQIANGWTKEEIQDTVNTAVLRQNYGVLSLAAAKQYHLKRQAGSRGIPPLDDKKVSGGKKELTENQKAILAEAGRQDLIAQAN